MSNHQVTYDLYLNTNLRNELSYLEGQAIRLDGVMSGLQKTLNVIGLSLGGHAIISAAKDWTQSAADFETAMNRIRFASENAAEGIKNNLFISNEADKFKIELQAASDAYGKFLAMIQGSGIASEKVRELHDSILMIGKIKHIGDGQIDAAVMNLGKMLEAGAMDARHLRPLEMQLSGIGAYISKELGVSIHELAILRNKGGLTDINPEVLITAINKMAGDLKQHLPEALQSIQSQTNELSNEWLRFKNDVVMTLKPELIEFYHVLENGVHWLSENKNSLIEWGKFLVKIAEFWVAYKASIIGVNLVYGGYKSIQGILLGQASQQISNIYNKSSAYKNEAASISEVVSALEQLNYVQNAQNGRFISVNGQIMSNTIGNRYLAAQINAQANAISNITNFASSAMYANNIAQIQKYSSSGFLGSASRVGGALSVLTGSVLPVAVMYLATDVISTLRDYFNFNKEYSNATSDKQFETDKERALERLKDINSIWSGSILNTLGFGQVNKEAIMGRVGPGLNTYSNFSLKQLVEQHPEVLNDANYINEVRRLLDIKGNQDLISLAKSLGFYKQDEFGIGYAQKMLGDVGLNQDLFSKYGVKTTSGINPTKKEDQIKPINFPKSTSLRGNTVTTIHIEIKEMSGMKNPSFVVKNMSDMEDIEKTVGAIMVKQITAAVNDSQQIGNR